MNAYAYTVLVCNAVTNHVRVSWMLLCYVEFMAWAL